MSTRIADVEFDTIVSLMDAKTETTAIKWHPIVNTETMQAWVHYGEHNNPTVRMQTTLQYPVQDCFNMLHQVALRENTQTVDKVHILEQVSDCEDVVLTMGKTPNSWIVAPREFCNARRWQRTKDGYLMVERFCDTHQKSPTATTGFIRGKTLRQALRLTHDTATSCKYEFVSSVEVGGWLPVFIINFFITSAPQQLISELAHLYTKYKSK